MQCAEDLGLAGHLQPPWQPEQAMPESPAEPTPEEQAAALEAMQRTIREHDMVHLLEMYCASKQMELPESLRTREMYDLETFAEGVSELIQLEMPQVPEEIRPQVTAMLAGIILKHFSGQMRPRQG